MPARQERRFVGVGFFLGRIEPDRHRHHRRLLDAGRLAQDAGERLALIRDFDALAGRPQMRQRRLPAFDLLLVRGLHLRQVVHEQERREMIVDAGALQAFAGGEEMLCAPAPRGRAARDARRAPTRRGTSRYRT